MNFPEDHPVAKRALAQEAERQARRNNPAPAPVVRKPGSAGRSPQAPPRPEPPPPPCGFPPTLPAPAKSFLALAGAPPGANKTEREYLGRFLVPRRESGEASVIMFEPFALDLTPGLALLDPATGERLKGSRQKLTYTPDFLLVCGCLEIHEVKGPHCHEDSWIKFQAAAKLFPFFRWFWSQKKGKGAEARWERKELGFKP